MGEEERREDAMKMEIVSASLSEYVSIVLRKNVSDFNIA